MLTTPEAIRTLQRKLYIKATERVNKFETPVEGSLVSNAAPPRAHAALVLAG